MKMVYTAESLTDDTIHYFKSESALNDFLQVDKSFYVTGSREVCRAMYNDLF
jgi:hypothetical protein